MRHFPIAPALAALVYALTALPLYAQVGNNNPTGISGIFNGQVNTGCSYDPYTGNAVRSITDIAVAGAVGDYPLALVRSANSRAPSTSEVFGWAGGWNHNYNWILEDSPTSNTANFQPKSYTVVFPDGRVETFRAVTWDTVYRVRPGADTPAQSTSAGVRERFLQLNLSNMYAYLILPDGGAVEFRAWQHSVNGHYYYKYCATGIYDPHGLKTTFQSEVTPNGLLRRLVWVIDPSGQRSLHFTYAGPNNPKIASIEASDGRVVNYNYIYCNGCRLDNVVYYNNANWTARYHYTASNIGLDLPPLLSTADDPMYLGPMQRIGYVYRTVNNPDGTTPAYGQIQSENYYDGATIGPAVSTLTVGESPNITYKRKETRGDGATRTFIYSGVGQINWASDFMGYNVQQHYDATTEYVDYVVDRNGHRTDYTSDPITGNITQIQLPLTRGDTPGQNQRPTINYSYTNSYYLHTIQGENGQTTMITRDSNNRATRIDYPDGGYETFSYDPAHFYQLGSHRMVTGGTETFAYDGRHRLQYYSDAYHNNPDNPSIQYFYDALDRVTGALDALSHPTNWEYNDRGQITTTRLPFDPANGQRNTIVNLYNADGTLQSRTDELGHVTNYIYDEYRRLKSVTPPVRGSGDQNTYVTQFYYGANPWDNVNVYKLTDSNITWVVPPSSGFRKVNIVYDNNRRETSVTVAPGTNDEATTSYGYDNVGNLTSVTNPRNRSTSAIYDERNRPSEIHDPYNNITGLTYDTAGRQKNITRPNGQVITNASFDEMNRVLQQNVTQSPGPLAVTRYTYYPSGLVNTMTDPSNSTDSHIYVYDLMGRKQSVTYPADSNGNHFVERFTYDTIGRLETLRNRVGKTQTFSYDALNRMIQSSWDDGGITPTATFSYDAASRLIAVNNINANISRAYFNDDLLRQETESISGGSSKTVAYTYNGDGRRASVTYPDYPTFAYTYTWRNQLKTVGPWATYTYDENGYTGDLTTRSLNNGTHSTYNYDPLDRVTWITHWLTSGARGFNYGYDDVSVGNLKYIRRTGTTLGDKGDVFSYDIADQTMGVGLNVTTPQSAPAPPRSIFYDANGNRTTFRPYGPTDNYVINNLNQYTSRNSNNATYNANGDITVTPEPPGSRSTYSYDAQNRVTNASKGNVSMSFSYDGLSRQVSRTIGGVTTYNVWDGWDLIEEYQVANGGAATALYAYGANGLITGAANGRLSYYYQDGSGSTSHLADGSGNLKEWYRYDLQGTPVLYNSGDQQINASAFAVRHLFTGQQWYQELGLYDLRNRFYSPDLGRFLQPDPIRFRGGNNLYRYCGNNSVTRWDPFGLQDAVAPTLPEGWNARVEVFGSNVPELIDPGGTGAPSGGGGGGPAGEGGRGSPKNTGITFSYGKPPRNSKQPGIMVPFDIYHPHTTAEFIIAGNIIEGGDTTDTTPAIDPIDFFSFGIAGLLRAPFRSVAAKSVMNAGARLPAIETRYAVEVASTSVEARAAIAAARKGATLYRGGELGESMAGESQYWSLRNPLSPNYPSRMGMPDVGVNFIMGGTLEPGAPAIANEAASLGLNAGGDIQIVTSPNGVTKLWFHMPDK